MRGYSQQKDSTNSNPQDSFLSKNIEDYTIKDCEDFLAKYQKDLDADMVRKRLEQLRPKVDNGTESSKKRASSPPKQEWHETTLGKLCLTALLIVAWLILASILVKIGMSTATGIGHFILMAAGYSGIKAIWHWD